ncbi:alpha-glucosidase [Exilibacterium tricleocarpae]|uniref:Alpha-glucosidase n=1 Tax=Exilibacterium tricleocarpae TaxID=2591008 RepID=A0A545TAL3_9GAMM|nr:alpha-amylase family glycosyl hydrolase [Exilibacterium tricleocarpae]TQV74263.1 alpha-glucosidase [Exilibacterium tricleocarpae]
MNDAANWWKGGVIYQIYPRSFMDSNNDGIGDLPGITEKLDYVAELGVDAIWISPFFTSPMRDFGYDIADYRNIEPMFGRLQDFEVLLRKAHGLGLKVIIDQVLSHSSDRHPWFQESRQSRTNARADWYVWADPKADGTPPNNWLSIFGGSAWSWDSRRRQYYLHNFLDSQPDLNFHNPAVRRAQLDNMEFWLQLGVDGFRLDVVNFYFHSRGLQDNPPFPEGATRTLSVARDNPYAYQRHVFDINQPENIAFLCELRALLERYPGSTSVGEISADDAPAVMARYTAGGDKLHMAYTFDLLSDTNDADYVRRVVRQLEDQIGDGWACWALGNHDVKRFPSRWGKHEDAQAYVPVALAMLLSLRGSVSLYQGEELGLPEAEVPYERIRDPYGLTFWPAYKGRDGCRTPMVWESSGGGFSAVEPWLPIDRQQLALAVDRQERDLDSTLQVVRRLLRWRKRQPALIGGDIALLEDTGDMLCWLRRCPAQQLLVALNMTGDTLRAPLPVKIENLLEGHGFNGRIERQQIVLEPYQALFAELAAD